MNEAEEAIKDIQEEFKEYGNSIQIETQGQDIPVSDPAYDHTNPANNKGTPTLSPIIYAFISDTSFKDQDTISKVVGKNVVGKRVKDMTFYTDIAFNKVESKIIYESKDYEIVYISEKKIQDTVFLYKIVAVN